MAAKERPILFQGAMVRALLDGSKTQTRRVIKPQPPAECGINYPLGNESWLDEPAPLRHHWEAWHGPLFHARPESHMCGVHEVTSPYGAPGDRLWARETWRPICVNARIPGASFWNVQYREGYGIMGYDESRPHAEAIGALCDRDTSMHLCDTGILWGRWRPSIFMPRRLSRITLEVTEVRAERVQDISEEDAAAEGVSRTQFDLRARRDLFHDLWDSINATPKPKKTDGVVSCYESYPWDGESGVFEHRGLPHYVYANPWVFPVSFRRLP